MRSRSLLATLLGITTLLLLATAATAHLTGVPGSGGPYEEPPPTEHVTVPPSQICDDPNPDWRNATTVYGVDILESKQCQPNDPRMIAASVVGTNNVPQEDLEELNLHSEAVEKCCDLDGDGDPDIINITLEVVELNGWSMEDDVLVEPFEIAPGHAPPFWAFVPKGTVKHSGDNWEQRTQMPTIPIRVEQGDIVNLKLENTHYLPHTIHLHGVDHPFQTEDGEGNDGVPMFSEKPVMPGENHTYTFQPRHPGTFFFHCHVQPPVHVGMGLGSVLIVEPNRPNNTIQTFNFGGGEVRAPSVYSQENYDREYDLIYHDIDGDLHEIVRSSNDPRVIAEEQNRDYNPSQTKSNYFLLNGRSFPYTLQSSNIVVDENEEVKLRVLNMGEETLSLHPHGHAPVITHLDGRALEQPIHRDVIPVQTAQRVDLLLNTTNDGTHSYGPGVWFMHDHHEKAVTTDGINPGGDITTITYEAFLNETTYMPETAMPINMFFTEEFYRGEIPIFQGMGMDSFLGQVAQAEAEIEEDEPAPIPAPSAGLLTLSLLLLGLAARGVKR